jgi:hypothetical protein
LILCGAVVLGGNFAVLRAAELAVTPESAILRRNLDQVQLVVTARSENGKIDERSDDLTTAAKFISSDSNIVKVTPAGRLLAVGNGRTTVTVSVIGATRTVPVEVTGVLPEPKVDFTTQVIPIMSKAGCNGGSCHATQHGKGGFVLSVLGYDPEGDLRAIVRDRMQRRINFNEPHESLMLKKPLMEVPHGGGRRLTKNSVEEKLLASWIGAGAPGPQSNAPRVTAVRVFPSERVCLPGAKQQLRVTAEYNTGETRDVTAFALFDSLDEGVAAIAPSGVYIARERGQTPIMVRYEGFAEISMVAVPYATSVDLASWKANNFIDELAADKFRELGIAPSPLCDDSTFLRRAFLDAIGSQPTVAETRAFLESRDPKKREALIDRLLGLPHSGQPVDRKYNERYAAWWSLKWSDLLRNSSNNAGEQGMLAFHNWLKESFRQNKRFDTFVREVVTAKGGTFDNGPANYYQITKEPTELAEATAQVFLGVRLQCARCHHHPFEKYSQEDYYSFAAFFSRVGTKFDSDFSIQVREPVIFVRSSGQVLHPRTGRAMPPTPLEGGKPAEFTEDPRVPLAEWLTSPRNELFARNVVNRYCGYLLGRGLVEPIDDLRATNPPSNVALMEALARDFREHGYDLKRLMRTIMTSRLYQLDSQPTQQNHNDTKFYSSFRVKRLSAEALLDAVNEVTGSPTKFPGLPLGTRAIELPDSNYADQFLVTFGKPRRASVCECERSAEENLSQALHTLNGDILSTKIGNPQGRIGQLLKAKSPHEQIVSELYLATLCRPPSPAEVEASRRFLQGSPSPQECYQDLLWALVNSKHFLFVR